MGTPENTYDIIQSGSYSYIRINDPMNYFGGDIPIQNNSLIYFNDGYKALIKLGSSGPFSLIPLYANSQSLDIQIINNNQYPLQSLNQLIQLYPTTVIPQTQIQMGFSIDNFNQTDNTVDGLSPLIVISSGGAGGAGGAGGGGMGGAQQQGGGAGAGSDPYITTFSGYTFELPHLNKYWNLFTHKPTDFSIIAHTHNYSSGNYFNQIKINYGNLKATIDYQKQKITSNNSTFKIVKTELTMKYNKQGKIIDETKLFDCIVFNHPVFEEVVLLVNWRNDYFHPMFKVVPTKDCSGILMMKEHSKFL